MLVPFFRGSELLRVTPSYSELLNGRSRTGKFVRVVGSKHFAARMKFPKACVSVPIGSRPTLASKQAEETPEEPTVPSRIHELRSVVSLPKTSHGPELKLG